MLLNFIRDNREELIRRTRDKVRTRHAPRATPEELENGVPLFLEQFSDLLVATDAAPPGTPAIGDAAARHGSDLLKRGFTIAQVVHDYGDICQAVTELAGDQGKHFETGEFHMLNLCLDNAIAEAVTEYARQRDENMAGHEAERLGFLVHEQRNLVNTASMSLQLLRRGTVAIGGSTGAVLERSLERLGTLINRSVAEIRLESGLHVRTRILLAEFIEEIEIAAAFEAESRKVDLTVAPVDYDVAVQADRQLLASAVSNLLQNAFKFTRRHGHVSLRAAKKADRVLIEVEDECGGLPPGKAEDLFRPFERRGADTSGLGLGLAISRKSIDVSGGQIRVRNMPGKGCVFVIELPASA